MGALMVVEGEREGKLDVESAIAIAIAIAHLICFRTLNS
jgi:hypothetical protein